MRYIIYFMLATSPLPLASVMPVWQWLWVLVVGLLAILAVTKYRGDRWPSEILQAFGLVLLFTVFGGGQALVPVVSDAAIKVIEINGLFQPAAVIYADADATISSTAYFLSHWVFFLCVFIFCDRRDKAAKLILFCGLIVTAYAIYGLFVYFSGNETVLWFKKIASPGALSSTFINRNNFAAYGGLGLLSLIAYWQLTGGPKFSDEYMRDNKISRFVGLLVGGHVWLFLAIVIICTAILLTQSRAGFFSVLAAVCIQLVSRVPLRGSLGRSSRSLLGALVIIVIAVFMFTFSGEELGARLQGGVAFDQRFTIFKYTLQAIGDRPIIGYGLGTFEEIFQMYRGPEVSLYFSRAHNDYLELALTAGIPAAVTLIGAFISIAIFLLKSLKFQSEYRACIILGLAALSQIGLHSLLDFPLQIPAVSYIWIAILAASVAIAKGVVKESIRDGSSEEVGI